MVMVFIWQDLKALWLSAKKDFEDLQTQLQRDMKHLGMSIFRGFLPSSIF